MSDFRKALIGTAVPIVVLSIISAVGVAASSGLGGKIGFALVWLVAAAWLVAAIIAAIVYAIKGKRQLAAGVLAGVGIGIVALGLSCFANTDSGPFEMF